MFTVGAKVLQCCSEMRFLCLNLEGVDLEAWPQWHIPHAFRFGSEPYPRAHACSLVGGRVCSKM